MSRYDIRHDDPCALGRAAAVRSARESDARNRARARGQSMSERLEEGFRLARFASRLRRTIR